MLFCFHSVVLHCCRGKARSCSFDIMPDLTEASGVTPCLVRLHGLVFQNLRVRGWGGGGGHHEVHMRAHDMMETSRTLVLASTPISSSSSKRFPVLDVRRSSSEASSASRAYKIFI